jgi:hypothetical protein
MLNELSPMSEEDIDELNDEEECEEKELLWSCLSSSCLKV